MLNRPLVALDKLVVMVDPVDLVSRSRCRRGIQCTHISTISRGGRAPFSSRRGSSRGERKSPWASFPSIAAAAVGVPEGTEGREGPKGG